MSQEITLAVVVAVTAGLAEIIKRLLLLKIKAKTVSPFVQLIAVIIGVLLLLGLQGISVANGVTGIIVGLASSGLFDATKIGK